MYIIRTIWEGVLLHQTATYSEAIAYECFGELVDQYAKDPGVSIQLIDDQQNVLTDYYIV